MSVVIRLCVVFALLSACSGTPRPPERYPAVETQLYSRQVIDTRGRFEEAIVGHELQGDGVEVTVAPDGVLLGENLGRPFVGSWEYRRGEMCVSLTEDHPDGAADRQCFRTAISGREVTLVPVTGT